MTLALVHRDRLPMLRAMECLSLAPASILDLDGGSLSDGAAADLVMFDPERKLGCSRDGFRIHLEDHAF